MDRSSWSGSAIRPAGVIIVLIMANSGCERAQRFPPPPATTTSKMLAASVEHKSQPLPSHLGWFDRIEGHEGWLEIPLQFVAEDTDPKEWQLLLNYWNEAPTPAGGRTAVLGLAPLEAATALAAQVQVESIKIKVPRGLPDPTPFIPDVNPPTYGNWILGKRLFFDQTLLKLSPTVTRSCADCHMPSQAFALNAATPMSGKRNVPSLLNSVYNRHQFWDGRADALEQVLWRQLEDERELDGEVPLAQSPGHLHVWPGLVQRLRGKQEYISAFEFVYGSDATADNVAKALATYLRTLLSGNAVVDQAAEHLKKRGGKLLEAKDFEPVLSDKVRQALPGKPAAKDAAQQLARGAELFHGTARCNMCHHGPLFTDHVFHNIGVGESAAYPRPGEEQGRFAYLPLGLKDRRMIGAFKTPSLRDVSRTAPYMHDGSIATLGDVVKYYNDGMSVESKYLDPLLTYRDLTDNLTKAQRLYLGADELAALEVYLWALRGEDLPPQLTEPFKK